MIRLLKKREPHHLRPWGMFEWDFSPIFERMTNPNEQWWPVSEGFVPHVDVVEKDNEYEVTVELPGMKTEDIHVEVQGQELWITGEKKEEHQEKDKTYLRIERRHGEFRRVLPLPAAVNEDEIEAKFEDGVLKVHIAKIEEAKPKHIKIES